MARLVPVRVIMRAFGFDGAAPRVVREGSLAGLLPGSGGLSSVDFRV